MVARWVAIISVSHIPYYLFLTCRPLQAHWTSHAHNSLSFLLPWLHFYTKIGPFSVCMFCLGISWALGLWAYLSHFFAYYHITVLHHISLFMLFILFLVLLSTCFASSFLHPKWWFFSFHCIEDSHIISITHPTNTDSEILNWKGHLVREGLYT